MNCKWPNDGSVNDGSVNGSSVNEDNNQINDGLWYWYE